VEKPWNIKVKRTTRPYREKDTRPLSGTAPNTKKVPRNLNKDQSQREWRTSLRGRARWKKNVGSFEEGLLLEREFRPGSFSYRLAQGRTKEGSWTKKTREEGKGHAEDDRMRPGPPEEGPAAGKKRPRSKSCS